MISTRAWLVAEMLQGRVRAAVFDVVQHGMPVAERASLAVLPAHADGHAVRRQRGER